MASLADLAPISDTVPVRDLKITVYPLRLSDIAVLLAKHQEIAGVIENGDILNAIMGAGPDAISDAVDLATREASGTASSAGLTLVEEGNILFSCIDMTIPEDEDELRDFQVALAALINRLGALKKRAPGQE